MGIYVFVELPPLLAIKWAWDSK